MPTYLDEVLAPRSNGCGRSRSGRAHLMSDLEMSEMREPMYSDMAAARSGGEGGKEM